METGDIAKRALEAVEASLTARLERERQRDEALRAQLEAELTELVEAYRAARTEKGLAAELGERAAELPAILQALATTGHDSNRLIRALARSYSLDERQFKATGTFGASRVGA